LPGTINHPNKTKRAAGRVPCMSRLIEFNELSYVLDDFPQPDDDGAQHARQDADDDETDDNLDWLIRTGGNVPKGERSEKVWKVINAMLRLGYRADTIIKTILDRKNGISAHIYDQSQPQGYARKQVTKAIKQIKFSVDEKTGKPYPPQNNIRIALLKLGVTVRYDLFADRMLLDGLEGYGPTLNDAALIHMRLTIERQFKLHSTKELFFDVVLDTAHM